MNLDKKEQSVLLRAARETIVSAASGLNLPQPPTAQGRLSEKRGIFVTLHKIGELRGCIGYVVGIKPLNQAVIDMAFAASQEDPRFPPVKKEEINDIEIEISVLSVPEIVQNPSEITVGKDGLIVKKGFRQGLLLPQVAVEWGWDRETFLSHACMKAGLTPDSWKETGVEIFIFNAQVFSESDG
ncbi:AmmeMemoRadiSam system protein A [candidate division WOR-3 bacterium]|nr:AmmeMemoRadiSam system protein A [candidate division WOR-3 bacterium]